MKNSRHATTVVSPYMLTRCTEKAIPLTYLYLEFATPSFATYDAYVDHVLARQQKILDLVRRNTHQAQLRQNLKYDCAIRAKAYKRVGVLPICSAEKIIPTSLFMTAFRSCFLTTSPLAHRHHNYHLRTTRQHSPWLEHLPPC